MNRIELAANRSEAVRPLEQIFLAAPAGCCPTAVADAFMTLEGAAAWRRMFQAARTYRAGVRYASTEHVLEAEILERDVEFSAMSSRELVGL